ncbi:DNA-directed RNA polymerase subunit D [Infirmifilum sp.]|uniref:DNA-directed RNA polymerase subunit D n=1 Tax=Infirmifilum sp. TaxID=2856575 RepID=UPI003D0F758D
MSSKPTLHVLEGKDKLLVVSLENVTPAFANSIRRALISEVPTLAIDEVIFTENTSGFWDEYIAHRLGLIPFKMSEDLYDALRDCYQNHGNECQVVFSLNEEALERPKTVFSGHLRFEGIEGIMFEKERNEVIVEPVSKYIPIVKLNKGQKIALTAIARMGVGKNHAKWQPVTAVGYKYKPIVKVLNPEVPEEKANKLINICPRRVFGYTQGRIVVINENACSLCRECVEKYPDIVRVEGDPSKIILTIETLGGLPPRKLLEVALVVLDERLSALHDKISDALNAFLAPAPPEAPSGGGQSF